MKTKHLLLIFFCIAFSVRSYAQTWPMPGAHWEYCRGGLGTDFRIFEYTGDTIINSTNYQVIEQINVSTFPNVGPVYTRYSNDTVYRYVQSQEYPFLIFNAQLSDVYTTFRTDLEVFADSGCRSILPVKVWQLDTLIFGSLTLKQWLLEDTLFDDIYSGSAQASVWKIVERIGFINDFPFTLNVMFAGNSCVFPSDMGGGFILYSYSDSTYSYTSTWNCSYEIGINDQSNETKIHLYPNPANSILNISISNNILPVSLTINNVWGQEIFQCILSDETNSVSSEKFPGGYYFVKCTSPNYTSTSTLIINR